MIYVILTYLLSPFIYLAVALKKKGPVNRILVIQTAKIGDLICTTPVFREIKNQYPSVHITALITPVTRELLDYNPYVDEIITIKKSDFSGFAGKIKLSALIRRGRYDIAVCLNPNVPYAITLFWALVPVRLSVMPDYSGTSFKLASAFFTALAQHRQGQMTLETYMQMLKSIGIESSNMSKEVYISGDAYRKVQGIMESRERPFIGIGVSSGNKMKELEAQKIIELIDKLNDSADRNIILVGSEQDMSIADSISSSVKKSERVINAAGKLSLSELPALIELLSLYIGVDSGITYMADALSIPLINIAGPADMHDQRPTGKHAVILQKELSCVPCSHAFKSPYACRLDTRDCVTTVTAEEIYSSAIEVISEDKV